MDVPDYKVGPGLLWVSDGWGAESEGFKTLSTPFLKAGEASHLASLPFLSKPLTVVS